MSGNIVSRDLHYRLVGIAAWADTLLSERQEKLWCRTGTPSGHVESPSSHNVNSRVLIFFGYEIKFWKKSIRKEGLVYIKNFE